jgi:hypothetical protein
MAEVVLSDFLGVLFDRLASPELVNFARQEGLGKKLEKWSKMLPRVEAVLDGAEEKQQNGIAVKRWLDDLRDLAYDADDILDEFATEALRQKLTGGNHARILERILVVMCFLFYLCGLFISKKMVIN